MEEDCVSEELQSECVAYFRAHPIWNRVLRGFRDKYSSYGRVGGRVVLQKLKPQDIEELEGFFGKSFHGQKSVTVSADGFRQAMAGSKFQGITLEGLLELYFGEPLVGKQEQRLRREQMKQEIMEAFAKDYQGTPVECVSENLIETIRDSEHQDLEAWDRTLRMAAEIYNHLPYRQIERESVERGNRESGSSIREGAPPRASRGRKLYLAVYAALLTGNPHAFDHGTAGGRLLYQMIQLDLKERGIAVDASEIFPAYKRNKSYLLTGIMLDDISNYALLYRVRARKGDGTVHKGMEGFETEHQIVQVPLAVIAEWTQVNCIHNEIYIVENPSVFAMLCEEDSLSETGRSYMCMNGQPRLAGLMVMELLARSGTRIWYAGDLDPEGLLIAQKLAQHYSGEFNYWHMEGSDYKTCRSRECISPKRMKMLDKITDERLRSVAEEIKEGGTAGYQELLFAQPMKDGKADSDVFNR